MGRGSNLSVIGLYNYSENLFNGLSLPAGMTDDDKSVLIDNILFECADLEVLYPSWTFMYRAISSWSKKQLPTWTRIYNLSQMEYDPIENFNRMEEVTETREGAQEHSGNDVVAMSGSDTDTSKTTGSDTHQTTGTDTEETIRDNSETSTGTNSTVVASDATDTHTGSDVTTEQKTAFDANTYADTRKTTLQHGETISNDTNSTTTGNASATIETDDDETVTTTHNTTVTDNHNTTVTDTHQRGTSETTTHGLKVSQDETFTRNVHMYGNIGVTTSQQMAEQEIELAPKLNIFNIIVEEFKERFCLQVY